MRQSGIKLKQDEQGLVAIVITMILMIILTLIVTGFAQLARREQRASLDRQLASQALYAAESGINEARRILDASPDDFEQNTCGSPGNLDGTSIQYTCLMMRQKLPTLEFENVQTNKSLITPIFPDPLPGETFDRLTVSWENKSGTNADFGPTTGFPAANTWGINTVGILRIDLVPAANISMSNLQTGVFTAFLRPKPAPYGASDGTVAFSSALSDQGKTVFARCDSSGKRKCSVTVTGLSADYYLRMRSIYNVADTVICAGSTACDGKVLLKGSQYEIDSTGKANDVLKRMKVRITKEPDYNGSRLVPNYSVESSEDLCKVYSVYPGGGSADPCP